MRGIGFIMKSIKGLNELLDFFKLTDQEFYETMKELQNRETEGEWNDYESEWWEYKSQCS